MSHICESLVGAARYLEQQGMSVGQLRTLHHPQRKLETFASTLRYFSQNKELKALNRAYADRIVYVANEHRKGGAGFGVLVERALQRWPL